MKKLISKVALACLGVVLSSTLAISAYAADIPEVTTTSTPTNQNEEIGIVDRVYKDGVYKLSDDTKDIYLPFFRAGSDRVIVDKEINKSGAIFAGKAIDVTKNLKGVQVLFSGDTVRVNANMEYSVIFADNVVIDSNIDKMVTIFANTVTITQNATINDDLICFANQIDMLGTVKGSFVGSANTTNISGTIEKDLRIKTQNIKLYEGNKILGKIYINTSNESLSVADKYPNAYIFLNKYTAMNKTQSLFDIVKDMLYVCIVLTLLYLLVDKLSKQKLFTAMKEKSVKHPVFTILSGIINLIFIPLVFITLIGLSIFGLAIVTMPALLVYVVSLIIVLALSKFIVGSVIYAYIRQKYMTSYKGFWYQAVGVFCTYLGIYILCKIPYIGGFFTMAIIILSVGIVFTSIFKKDKNVENEIVENTTQEEK